MPAGCSCSCCSGVCCLANSEPLPCSQEEQLLRSRDTISAEGLDIASFGTRNHAKQHQSDGHFLSALRDIK